MTTQILKYDCSQWNNTKNLRNANTFIHAFQLSHAPSFFMSLIPLTLLLPAIFAPTSTSIHLIQLCNERIGNNFKLCSILLFAGVDRPIIAIPQHQSVIEFGNFDRAYCEQKVVNPVLTSRIMFSLDFLSVCDHLNFRNDILILINQRDYVLI